MEPVLRVKVIVKTTPIMFILFSGSGAPVRRSVKPVSFTSVAEPRPRRVRGTSGTAVTGDWTQTATGSERSVAAFIVCPVKVKVGVVPFQLGIRLVV